MQGRKGKKGKKKKSPVCEAYLHYSSAVLKLVFFSSRSCGWKQAATFKPGSSKTIGHVLQ